MLNDFRFENFIGIQLSLTANNLKAIVVKKFEQNKFYISFDDWLNMLPIIREDGISQKKLAEILGKDKTTVSRLVDSLVLKGVVKKKVNKNDRRSVGLCLTEKGLAIHRKVLPEIDICNEETLKKLTKKEIQFLTKILLKLRAND